jgi:hypothetical protein
MIHLLVMKWTLLTLFLYIGWIFKVHKTVWKQTSVKPCRCRHLHTSNVIGSYRAIISQAGIFHKHMFVINCNSIPGNQCNTIKLKKNEGQLSKTAIACLYMHLLMNENTFNTKICQNMCWNSISHSKFIFCIIVTILHQPWASGQSS